MRFIPSAFARSAVAALLLLTAPGRADQPVAAIAPASPTPVVAPASVAPEALNAHPALWVVRDADTSIYLFGTVHVLKPQTRWWGGPVKAAFDKADELKLEIVEPEAGEMASLIGRIGMAPAGSSGISTRMTPAQRKKYLATMTANGLPWQQFEQVKPWLAGITLAVAPLAKLSYSSDAGVEKTLTAAATAAGKPVSGLETPAEQLGYFDGLSDRAQLAFLTATVDELPKMKSEFAGLVAAWSTGRDRKLADEMNDSLKATPELAQVLLFTRNRKWADWIAARMQRPGTVFIAVGAGHLAGKGSVQADLAARGFTAQRVPTGG